MGLCIAAVAPVRLSQNCLFNIFANFKPVSTLKS